MPAAEPSAGSDVANLTTTAKKTEDGKHYIVNGEKVRISVMLIWLRANLFYRNGSRTLLREFPDDLVDI